MNKKTEREFKFWFDKANEAKGALMTIAHADGDLKTFITEATRRAFTAGVNAVRERK